jgi:hypothetical protein
VTKGGTIQGGLNRADPGKAFARQREEVICFWCRQEGHHQVECNNPPFCFRCKESGHLAAKCLSAKSNTIHMYGFGFPGQGYYCLKTPGAKKAQQPRGNVGKIMVKSGVGWMWRKLRKN